MDPNAPDFLISTRSEEEISSGRKGGFIGLSIAGAIPAVAGTIMAANMAGAPPDPPQMILSGLLGLLGYGLMWSVSWGLHVMNSLIRLRNRVRQAWSLIEVQLKRRRDLIPSLVEVVRKAARHESDLQQRLAELRTAGSRIDLDGYQRTSRGIVALAEDHPELKTSGNFQRLHRALTETEDRIALARGYYSEMASFLNTRREQFPDRLFARMGGVQSMPLYLADEGEREAVEIRL